MTDVPDALATPEQIARGLAAAGYLADERLSTTVWLASQLGRPILAEGEPGVGKTALAHALATLLDSELLRLQCHEGIDHDQAVAAWDHARQLLHIRALEASGDITSAAEMHDLLHHRDFLLQRPILAAVEQSTPQRPAVLLIDEIDRADDEFDAFLLEFLAEWSVTIAEYGTIRAAHPPLVILTSNRTRDLHDALRRRCLYQWFEYPGADQVSAIVRQRHPELADDLATAVVAAATRLRSMCRRKPPGLAEVLDWADALARLGVEELDGAAWWATSSTMVKDPDDAASLPPDLFDGFTS